MKRLVMATAALCSVNVLAMPTKAELTKAQPLVVELMAPTMEAFKSAEPKDKAAAAVKVGDASTEFAQSAETEAVKFLLLKGSVNFYARGEAYDKAADALAALQESVKGVPPEVTVEIVGKATAKISESKAPRLFTACKMAKLQVQAANEVKALPAKMKKVQSDALRRRYAEALAVSGDWKKAYAEFVRLGDAKVKKHFESEAEGKAKAAESGEFWWSYEPELEGSGDFFRARAAVFYRKALADGEITGLKKNIVEQRIAGMAAETMQEKDVAGNRSPSVRTSVGALTGKAWQERGNMATLTLKNGDVLEFAKCPAGVTDYRVGCLNWEKFNSPQFRRVTISRPFWIMTRPLAKRNLRTYLQFDSDWQGQDGLYDYVRIRHVDVEAFAEVLTDDFKGSLPKGYVVRDPSLAEWEYAIRANSRSESDPYSHFDDFRSEQVKKIYLKDPQGKSPKNAWGLHEFCTHEQLLDKFSSTNSDLGIWGKELRNDKLASVQVIHWEPSYVSDPLVWAEGPEAFPAWRRAGQTWFKQPVITDTKGEGCCRLVVGPDLVSEWRAKHGKK